MKHTATSTQSKRGPTKVPHEHKLDARHMRMRTHVMGKYSLQRPTTTGTTARRT